LVLSPGLDDTQRHQIQQVIAQQWDIPAHRGATIGLAVLDMKTSRPLVQWRSQERLIPASVTKIFSTGFAADSLGWDYRFSTDLLAITPRHLLLRGGFDPTFGSTRVPGAATSEALALDVAQSLAHHLQSLPATDGPIILECAPDPLTESIPGPWDWEDLGDYYGAGVHRLNWNDNLWIARFQAGVNVGSPATLQAMDPPPLGGESILNLVRTGPPRSGDQVTLRFRLGGTGILARGTIPQGESAFPVRGTLPHPGAAFLGAVRQQLPPNLASRIEWKDSVGELTAQPIAVPADAVNLWSLPSPPLRDIIEIVHRQSFNLYAEAVFLAPVMRDGASSEPLSVDGYGLAVQQRHTWLKSLGLDTRALRLRDGSGLSNSNRISPLETTHYLIALSRRPVGTEWINTLAVHGESGDLAKRRDQAGVLRGRLRAKTGLITGTRALAGIIEHPQGPLAVAITVQNSDLPWTAIDQSIDETLATITQTLTPRSR
jgi:D-alanyl-D-alanine carboxypeptidase/D-alanyl-D-alanine-endopeptidase (penicillin-binding protein 4)